MKKHKLWLIPVAVGLALVACLTWYTRPSSFSAVLHGVDLSTPHRITLTVKTFSEGVEQRSDVLYAWSGTGEYDELMALWDGVVCRKDVENFLPGHTSIHAQDETTVHFAVTDGADPTGHLDITVGAERLIAAENPTAGRETVYRLDPSPRQALLAYGMEHGELQ